MKIGILFNHQHEALRIALASLLPTHQLVSFDADAAGPSVWPVIADTLAGCDVVISHSLHAGYGALATPVLALNVRRLVLMPVFEFGGFHPDTVTVELDGEALAGPTGTQHSRLAVAGYLAGLSRRQAAALFNRLSFVRLGYLDRFATDKAALLRNYRAYRIDFSGAFDGWLAQGCFVHGPAYPRMNVMLSLAAVACAMIGVAPPAPPDAALLHDPLASAPLHPVFPDIAGALGLAASGAYRGAVAIGSRPRAMSTETFVSACYAMFRFMPLAALRQVDGVAAAIAALGLTEMPRKWPAPPPPSDVTTSFLAWQGTVLGVEAASSLLVHYPAVGPADGCSDVLADLPTLPMTEPATTQIGGTVTLSPCDATPALAATGGDERRGAITLMRGGRFLQAAPGRLAAIFSGSEASLESVFLPCRATDLRSVRLLASQAWRVTAHVGAPEAGAERPAAAGMLLAGALVRLLPGFQLGLADWQVDLRHGFPQAVDQGDGVRRFRMTAGTTELLLTEAPDAPARPEQLLQDLAERRAAPAEGSAEAFALARNACLVVTGTAEILHPPLTACSTDSAWAAQAYSDHPAPQQPHEPRPYQAVFGPQRAGVSLFRSSDSLLLLEPGCEGVVLNQHGVLKDFDRLAPSGQGSRVVRAVQTCRLLDLDLAHNADTIDGPVCVFYSPGLPRYDRWGADGLLALHILEPYLPADTRLVLPGAAGAGDHGTASSSFTYAALLSAFGFDRWPTITVATPAVGLRQALWVGDTGEFNVPAIHLESFRARAMAARAGLPGGRRRVILQCKAGDPIANLATLETIVHPLGFETVILADLTSRQQIDLFLDAAFIIGAGSALAATMLCPPGTRILELSADRQYRPRYCTIASKLGLIHGVLPCPPAPGGGPSDLLMVDGTRLSALVTMLLLTND